MDISVPTGTLVSGNAASFFGDTGTIKVGQPPVFQKDYDFKITPTQGIPDATGFSAKASAVITFK